MKRILVFLFLLAPIAAQAEIKTEPVTYTQGDVELESLVMYDDALSATRPGVLVTPAWKGITDFEKEQARKLVEMGYVALVVDVYGKKFRPKDMAEAAKLSGAYKADRPILRRRMKGALDVLKKRKEVNPKSIGAIGFCFGGTSVLELARSGADVAATVSFHGNLATPLEDDAKNIKGSVLVLHGADDPYVSQQEVLAFVKEMQRGKVKDWQLVQYSDAVHSFMHPEAGTDKSKGAAYNEKAAKRAWVEMTNLFNAVLKK